MSHIKFKYDCGIQFFMVVKHFLVSESEKFTAVFAIYQYVLYIADNGRYIV